MFIHFKLKRKEYRRITKQLIEDHPDMKEVINKYLEDIAEHTLIETSRGKVLAGKDEFNSNIEEGRKWNMEKQDGIRELARIKRELTSALGRIDLMMEDGWEKR